MSRLCLNAISTNKSVGHEYSCSLLNLKWEADMNIQSSSTIPGNQGFYQCHFANLGMILLLLLRHWQWQVSHGSIIILNNRVSLHFFSCKFVLVHQTFVTSVQRLPLCTSYRLTSSYGLLQAFKLLMPCDTQGLHCYLTGYLFNLIMIVSGRTGTWISLCPIPNLKDTLHTVQKNRWEPYTRRCFLQLWIQFRIPSPKLEHHHRCAPNVNS